MNNLPQQGKKWTEQIWVYPSSGITDSKYYHVEQFD